MTQVYDFIVIGGGILGASTAMQLQQIYADSRILLVEKESGLAQHQTGHNSGVIHAGVYYKPGTLKARFCLEGNRATKTFCDEHDIPYRECGKVLVATNDLEMERMRALWDRTEANGLERYWLDHQQLREREPNIRGIEGIFVPSSGIVSYSRITQRMVDLLRRRGGQLLLGAEVQDIEERDTEVRLLTSKGIFKAGYTISCAGLMSDRIVGMLGLPRNFTICPFRGEYYRLPEELNNVVQHMIYPIPDPATPFLGVHLTPMIGGELTVGPNAVLALSREGYHKSDINISDTVSMLTTPGIVKLLSKHLRSGMREMRNSLFKQAYLREVQKYCPQIELKHLHPYPAGVRAQAVSSKGEMIDDFLFINSARTFNVCNAPSPAATSSIPIGRHICEQVQQLVGDLSYTEVKTSD